MLAWSVERKHDRAAKRRRAMRSEPWAGICSMLLLSLALVAPPLREAHAQPLTDEARALRSRAAELYRAGKAGEAIPLAKRALALHEKALPADHPDIATDINNLAEYLEVHGEFAEAERLHKRALEIRQKALPAGHLDIAVSLNN